MIFRTSEHNGVYLLLLLILSINFISFKIRTSEVSNEQIKNIEELILKENNKQDSQDSSQATTTFFEEKENKKPLHSEKDKYARTKTSDYKKASYSRLKIEPFDPNTVSEKTLKKFGLSPYAITNWVNYRKKGGLFNNCEQLAKIYGLKELSLNQLMDHCILKSNQISKTTGKTNIISLNKATAQELQQLKGIGPVLSERIIKYRRLLGGFMNKKQLMEVYGLDSTLYHSFEKQVVVKDTLIKINLNGSFKELIKHPYLDKSEVAHILKYKKQHGAFTSLEQFNKLHGISDNKRTKILPYLSVDEN